MKTAISTLKLIVFECLAIWMMGCQDARAAVEKSAQRIYAESVSATGCIYRDGIRNGSCFLFDSAKGYVIGNFHTLADAEERITVSMGNERIQRPVEILFADPSRDISILKVNGIAGRIAKAIPISKRKQIYVGEKVYAIGHPGVSENALLDGIISTQIFWGSNAGAGGITLSYTAYYHQSFANTLRGWGGVSGGVILDSYGEAIGVHYAGASNGLSLARPIWDFLPAIKQVVRPHLIVEARVFDKRRVQASS